MQSLMVSMATQIKWNKSSQFQSVLILGLFLFFVGHFVLLSPSSLEDDFGGMRVIEPKDLLAFLKNEPFAIAPEVPLDTPPAYSLRDSIMFSSQGEKPNVKMTSRKSNLYQKEQLVHSRDVIVEFPDHTEIEAKEAIFFLKEDKVHFYGHVHTTFPNGAELISEFAEAFLKPVTRIVIPTTELVFGSKKDPNSSVNFTAQGLEYTDSSPKNLNLLQDVKVQIIGDKITHIDSDQAVYTYEEGHLHFSMNDRQPLSAQFVKVHQKDLDLKSRTLEVDTTTRQKLQTITALTDVWMKDSHDPEKVSTGTSGQAIYDDQKNEVTLTDFPQVYQDNDTITGDVIIFHRNTDLIEVKQSNAIYNDNESKRSQSQ